jgi:hypothetical protein
MIGTQRIFYRTFKILKMGVEHQILMNFSFAIRSNRNRHRLAAKYYKSYFPDNIV